MPNQSIMMDFPMERRTVLITGGCGYSGFHIALALSRDARISILLYDLQSHLAPEILPNNVQVEIGDICDEKHLAQILLQHKVTAVIHTAGYGLFGTSNLTAFDGITRQVNVGGTASVLNACQSSQVNALVYTSTLNVAFRGEEIINQSERDCPGDEKPFLDEYSRSKYEAEQLVLNFPQTGLKRCVLRLGGIFGPGEKSMLPRTISAVNSGIMNVAYCLKSDLKIDLVHIDNVVQAHVKALNLLLAPNQSSRVDGEVFSITDDHPTNLRFFLEPFNLALSGTHLNPLVEVHPLIILALAWIFNLISQVVGQRFRLPFWGLTPMEARKITVTHYFSIEKARAILGYQPTRPSSTTSLWADILSSYGLTKLPKQRKDCLFSIQFGFSMPLIASSCFALLFLFTCCL